MCAGVGGHIARLNLKGRQERPEQMSGNSDFIIEHGVLADYQGPRRQWGRGDRGAGVCEIPMGPNKEAPLKKVEPLFMTY